MCRSLFRMFSRLAPVTAGTILAFGCLTMASQAADFPNRPLHFVVPFGPGGASDQLARLMATRLADRLGQPVVVENKPGAGTILGIMAVKNAEPDGHTFLLGGTSGVVNQAMDRSVNYHVSNDFSAVAIVGEVPYALVVNAAVPARDFVEFLALLKSQPDKFNYASGGVGSSNHFATELLLRMTGTKATHVPYNSSATSLASVVTGETQFIFDTPISAKPQIAAGKVRPLAMSTPSRSRSLPDVPTVAESGVAGYEVTGFFAVVVPAKTPKDVIVRLNREISAVMEEPELRTKLLALGLETRTSTPDGADRRFAGELVRWTKLAQDLKLQK